MPKEFKYDQDHELFPLRGGGQHLLKLSQPAVIAKHPWTCTCTESGAGVFIDSLGDSSDNMRDSVLSRFVFPDGPRRQLHPAVRCLGCTPQREQFVVLGGHDLRRG